MWKRGQRINWHWGLESVEVVGWFGVVKEEEFGAGQPDGGFKVLDGYWASANISGVIFGVNIFPLLGFG